MKKAAQKKLVSLSKASELTEAKPEQIKYAAKKGLVKEYPGEMYDSAELLAALIKLRRLRVPTERELQYPGMVKIFKLAGKEMGISLDMLERCLDESKRAN
jgi:hypothetical protein